jgi:putative spermidine/putrescine transport system ATP-binding protein
MAFLEIDKARKVYGANTVVQSFELSVQRGEFVSFLGPSGCGKTTTLRMVAGFEIPTSGTIRINDRDVTQLRPNQRKVGMMFQAYALFPNMTVAENVGFGLKVAKAPAAEIKSRVEEMLNLIKLPQMAGRYPYQLSGGQQQRVALARALANNPPIVLADEPTGNLDSTNGRLIMRLLHDIHRARGTTLVLVTHDAELAAQADARIVLRDGRVVEHVLEGVAR